jgi:hypothetical protein
MTSLPDVDLHFNGPWEEPGLLNGSGRPFYASPAVETTGSWNGHGDDRITWRGNFFDDVRAWDELLPDKERGVSTKLARIEFPGAEMSCHMSAIGPQTYDKAVKHGPGRIVILVKGDGMGAVTTPRGWENSELYHSEVKAGVLKQGDSAQVRIVSPLDEGSLFAVPDDWYHQHFNTSSDETRFLVLHPLPQFAGSPYRYQMEYADEDPWVRGAFESALAAKGLESLMPEEAYADGGGQSTGEAGG